MQSCGILAQATRILALAAAAGCGMQPAQGQPSAPEKPSGLVLVKAAEGAEKLKQKEREDAAADSTTPLSITLNNGDFSKPIGGGWKKEGGIGSVFGFEHDTKFGHDAPGSLKTWVSSFVQVSRVEALLSGNMPQVGNTVVWQGWIYSETEWKSSDKKLVLQMYAFEKDWKKSRQYQAFPDVPAKQWTFFSIEFSRWSEAVQFYWACVDMHDVGTFWFDDMKIVAKEKTPLNSTLEVDQGGRAPVPATPPAAPRAERTPPRAVKLPELRVSENRRFLVQADGRPFFYLGDTAWELFHRLNREEADLYLVNRARHGFTVIQAVVVAELDGLRTPNAYGHLPFHDFDSRRPNEGYFAHVDYIVDRASELGLYIGMLPTWGRYVGGADMGQPEEVFFNAQNAADYGRFLARRYGDKPIIWVLGGDRLADKTAEVWTAMAQGICEVVGQRQLFTFHPRGGTSSSRWFHQADWLDFNMLQSGHSAQSANYFPVERDYALQPPKPTFDGEPTYEYPPDAMPPNLPVGALQVRRNAYWAVFAGAFGHTYGTHPIWQMDDTGRWPLWHVVTPWHQALDLPGATQLIHLKRLMLSRPFLTRIPDQSLLVPPVPGGVARIQATRDGQPGQDDATYLMAYFPEHRRVIVNTGCIAAAKLRGWWFNPRTGEATPLGELANAMSQEFEPPTRTVGEDWVLVLDDAARAYPAPGHP